VSRWWRLTRHWFEKSLERVGWSLADLRVALELGSNEAIKEAALRGAEDRHPPVDVRERARRSW
jgi:hypothetical protein